MDKQKKQHMITVLLPVVLVIGLIVVGVFLLTASNKDVYALQQNIYFLEYENEYVKNDTIIFKYDPIKDEVVEIGRVPGYLYNCIINQEENFSEIIGTTVEVHDSKEAALLLDENRVVNKKFRLVLFNQYHS